MSKLKTIIIFFLICCGFNALSQRLSFGFSYEFVSLNYTHFRKDYFFSNQSYRGYYLKKNQFSYAPTFKYSAIFNIDYGRYTFTGCASMTNSGGYKFAYSYPIANDQYVNYYSKIEFSTTEFSPSLSYSFFSKSFTRLFVESGFAYVIPVNVTEKMAVNKDFKSYWSNRDELKTFMDLSKPYYNGLIGVGVRVFTFSFGLKYYFKLNNINTIYYSYFTMNMSAAVNFSKLRKHYIYIN